MSADGIVASLRSRLRRIPLASWLYHKLRGALLPLGAGVSETPYGFRMAGNAAMQAGRFEHEEVLLLRSLLGECAALIDVGANVGLYTCLARSMGRRAVAVEPHPDNLRVLRANLAANGWDDTEVVPMGLAQTPGSAELYGTDTGASLLAGWASLPRRTLLRRTIPVTTLDTLLEGRFAGERLLIKADIEGAEYAMLRGAAGTLDRSPAPAWMVEICLTENFPQGANPDYVATFDEFFSRGYMARTANDAMRPVTRADVVRWASNGQAESGSHNYLFTR